MTALLLGAAYALLAALLLSFNLHTRFQRTLKYGVIVLTSLFYVGTYWGIQSLRGWALAAEPPQPFRLHWAIVQEPDKANGTPGKIYLLASQPTEEPPRPRLYALPFSYGLAESVEEARPQMEGGRTLTARMAYKYAEPPSEGEAANPVPYAPGGASYAEQEPDPGQIYLRILPPPPTRLPPKDPDG